MHAITSEALHNLGTTFQPPLFQSEQKSMTNMFRLTPFARCMFCMISVALKLTNIPVKTLPSIYLGAAHGFLGHGFVVHYLHHNVGDAKVPVRAKFRHQF